jgi:uncharacterized protein YciI
MHFLLFYDLVDDFVAKRAPYRAAHLALAKEAHIRGELVLAGALADPPAGSVFVFRGPTAEAAERFAAKDPYVQHGVAKGWRVRPWTTVVGDGAEPPAP